MKLTKIALSLVVIAGAAITGGSWYTGKQVEEKYQELLTLGNTNLKQLKVYGIDAEIKNVSFERGVFSSAIKYQLEAKTAEETFVFEGNDQLFHGPLPLNHLKQGKFLPVMASAESNISTPEKLKPLFGDKPILTGTNTIDYTGVVDGELTVNELNMKEEKFELQIGAITAKYAMDKDGNGPSTINIPNIVLKGIGAEQDNFDIALQGTTYHINVTEKTLYEMLTLGDVVAEMQSLSMNFSDGGFEYKDLKSNGYAKLNGDRYESASDFNGNFVLYKEGKSYPLGKLNADMFLETDAKSLNEVMTLVNTRMQNGEANEATDAAMQAAALDLVQKAPKLHLKTFSLENEKGKSDLSLFLNLAEFKLDSVSNYDELIALFKQSAFTLNVNIASIEAFIKTIVTSQGSPEEEAKLIVEQIVQTAKASESFVVDNETIKLKLEIDNGKIKLNDRELSESEVQGALFMLMMGLGGMGL